ncbi:hypothetical protein VTJ04DRAFT_2298 [Mycothermus thermophilus]|uniref:uncharacterized protein n=1 Tax=Humicola insolens TaxID=85995 RepID=UPI0037426684
MVPSLDHNAGPSSTHQEDHDPFADARENKRQRLSSNQALAIRRADQPSSTEGTLIQGLNSIWPALLPANTTPTPAAAIGVGASAAPTSCSSNIFNKRPAIDPTSTMTPGFGTPTNVNTLCDNLTSLNIIASKNRPMKPINHHPADPIFRAHLSLLTPTSHLDELNEISTTPIFTEPVRRYALSLAGAKASPFKQYGLLAGHLSEGGGDDATEDRRIFWNISAPSSFFICGSQGSGKSHTLSCLLENALLPCKANQLPRPLTGIVFHYDTFISDSGGAPCEAAWLSSNPNIHVRVLCAPTNSQTIRKIYKRFPNITVEELRLNESDLNTKRMLDLMAVSTGGNLPLYLHVVQRILRDLRIEQQRTGSRFNYTAFKKMLHAENLTEMQLAPLKQRLETLESFMVEAQAKAFDMFKVVPGQQPTQQLPKQQPPQSNKGTSWTPKNGQLTIVDLSCPCVTPEMACSLFNICLSLFLEQDSSSVGRVVALDEAHKYMTESQECMALTESLLATIRLQRHLGARVIISTQEPTISPKLLDLCSVTIVHRFTSPDWLLALKRHLAGVSAGSKMLEKAKLLASNGVNGDAGEEDRALEGADGLALGSADPAMELFSRIVELKVGEALMFAPSAIVAVRKGAAATTVAAGGNSAGAVNGGKTTGTTAGGGKEDVKRLGHGVLKVRIRNRVTADGGRSVMAL